MLQFENSFFEAEVRDGFYVPSIMKKMWAAGLMVLHEVDRICKKYDIQYFADWGTMLGAVRHGGMIPWDDDVDIVMKREDYEKFLQVADEELPEGFAVLNVERCEAFWHLLPRVVAKRRICFDAEHLKQFHGYPYSTGIDIFILDRVASNPEQERERTVITRYILGLTDVLGTEELSPEKKEKTLRDIENVCRVTIDRSLSDMQLKKYLYLLAERMLQVFNDDKDANYAQVVPWVLYHGSKGYPAYYYDVGVRVPFENTEIVLPTRYDEMLQKKYGNYMKLVRDAGGHDYPGFKFQKEDFEKILGHELPCYHYEISEENIETQRQLAKANSYKVLAKVYISRLAELLHSVKQGGENTEADLIETQQTAIELGNLIDYTVGEQNAIVPDLEQYCEEVFCLYQALQQGEQNENAIIKMAEILERVTENVEALSRRKEIVFLPFKGEHWPAFLSVYEAAKADENCDVYVVPIPYYYKEYDGSFAEMKYDLLAYPKNVQLMDYEQFDLELHHPDMIFIQNPYDEWDSAISIPPEFYSSKIKKFTERLVYIPYFEVEEFVPKNEREYWNMQYYCTMPGVVNADSVIVQSENMKHVYVEKLVEFAGEETREMWEKKIFGIGSPLQDVKESSANLNGKYPDEWKNMLEKKNGEKKRVLLFFVNMSSLIQSGEEIVRKIEGILETFSEYKQDVAFIWKEDAMIHLNEKLIDGEIYKKYKGLLKKYRAEQFGIYAEDIMDDVLLKLSDAYYGTPSALAQKFQMSKKPVMILDVNV